jgi:hypothetical protein
METCSVHASDQACFLALQLSELDCGWCCVLLLVLQAQLQRVRLLLLVVVLL